MKKFLRNAGRPLVLAFFSGAAALFAASTGAAQARFSLEQVLSAPFPSDLLASPALAGRAAPAVPRVAWVFNLQGRRNVWLAEGPEFQARPITSYAADDGQEIGGLAWSPDGPTLVYVRGGPPNSAGEIPNPTSNPAGAQQEVWAMVVEGGSPPRVNEWQTPKSWGPVRLGEGHSPAVSPQGDRVAFVHGDDIWVAPISGASPAERFFLARGAKTSPAWSPGGRRLAFVSDRGNHSWIGIYDPGYAAVRYVAPTVDRDNTPRWSPDGRHLAFLRFAGDGVAPWYQGERDIPWSILVADVETGEAREIWHAPARPGGSFSRQSGDAVLGWAGNERLFFTSEQDGWNHLYSVSSSGGEAILLTPGECEVEHASLSPDGRSLVYSSNCGDIDRRHLWRAELPRSGQTSAEALADCSETGARAGQPARRAGSAPPAPRAGSGQAAATPTVLTAGPGIEWSPQVLSDGTIVFFASDTRHPAAPYRIPAGGGARQPLAPSSLPGDFPAAQLVEPQPVVFKAADGLEIHGQLFLPPGDKTTRRPAVIFVHGGPIRQMLLGWHYLYYYHNAYGLNQYLASQGYVVLSVNYRSGIGYGRAFRLAARRGPRGASEYQDVVAAAQYLRGRSDVDPARLGIWGGSYGGYLTAMALARNSDLFAGGVDLHGVHDWSVFRQREAPLPADVAELAKQSSPVSAVNSWRSPVLLIHGDDDRNVSFSQTVDLVAGLRAQKVSFEQLIFPDEVHDFLRHAHWLEAYHAAADFFRRYLKPH